MLTIPFEQSSLFASWFSCKYHHHHSITSTPHANLTFLVGLGGIYWLHLNWGRYTSSPRKMALTVVNVLITGIGATIVSTCPSR